MILPLIELVLDQDAAAEPWDLDLDDWPHIERYLADVDYQVLVKADRNSHQDIFVIGQAEKSRWLARELVLPEAKLQDYADEIRNYQEERQQDKQNDNEEWH